MIDVLMIESGDGEGIFQEIAEFLSTKTQCRVVNLQTHSDQTAVDDTLSFRNLEIRPKERTVYRDGKSVVLSHYEFSALLYLAQPPNWVFSKEQIYTAVWKAPGDGGAAVPNIICQIRHKIGEGYIETVVGSGYKFIG